MGNLGAFALLGALVILTVLCHTGYSLRCYSCFAISGPCNKNTTCIHNLNTCIYVKAASKHYYSCWDMANCNIQTITKTLKERELKNRCCQKDMCNRNGAVTFLGTSVLLVVPLLAIAWNLSL